MDIQYSRVSSPAKHFVITETRFVHLVIVVDSENDTGALYDAGDVAASLS